MYPGHNDDSAYGHYWSGGDSAPGESLFATTMRDMEKQFFDTFPAARMALLANNWDMTQEPACPADSYPYIHETAASESEYPSSLNNEGLHIPSLPITYDSYTHMRVDDSNNGSLQASSPSSFANGRPQNPTPSLGNSSLDTAAFQMSETSAAGSTLSYSDRGHVPSQDVPIVPSQDYPPPSEAAFSPYSDQTPGHSRQTNGRYLEPAMGSLEQPMSASGSRYPQGPQPLQSQHIVPNPNLPVQQIVIVDRPPMPSTYSPSYTLQPDAYSPPPPTSYDTKPAYNATHQTQYTGSPGSYSHHASRDDSNVVPPSWSPPSTVVKPESSPSPMGQPAPIESEETASTTPSNTGTKSKPAKKNGDKKPPLACLFCRGRKIACGAPVPGGDENTCK
ncbi:hypothetical protein CC1G_09318 [Coprinopsis cinerea okayama7|uniref:Uncharacterized protein n=1 Tax=Coprinopsis cinerea (strain Okayama-7 / 130 / ATCC MYA-4618 / FGSC 9003) TaxID=240176 RepID=A8N5L3_COPC7|nr:hypothetical protein CC1G_09318 [Coprinopsis cinerea okayama7\|eukprot:XP_001830158.2 hypothetical protein CC1G_09318 [Coprinopsis cinerea okayama7\